MKIAVMESLGVSKERMAQLEGPFIQQGHTFVHYEKTSDMETLKAEGRDADALIVANMPLPNEVIASYDRVRFVDVAFTGVDHIGLAAAKEKNMVVSNASGYSTEAVAELAAGSVLCVYRSLPQVEQLCRNGRTKEDHIGQEIKGKTVGIVGLGKIGMRSAEIFHAFGANILANKKHPCEVPSYITLTSLEEVLQKSDIVLLHCPLNDETRDMIGAKEIARMKKNALLVNLARGPVVNSEALVKALEQKRIAGAVIDVFAKEPPLAKDEILLQAPNVFVMPHIGFATKEAMEERAEIVFANLAAWMQGTPANRIL
jgi:phosphoglycerate dehydrogenase-like enzyme